jgi:hypothetical protein
VLVEIRGRDLPGRTFEGHGNVHVGVQRKRSKRDTGKSAEVVDLVPGDAPRARWEIIVDVSVDLDDFRGPYVEGRPGQRFVYLSWNDVAADGGLTMFRRAKLVFAGIPPDVLAAAARPGWRLVGDLALRDACGGPVCATLRPPAIGWSAAWPT